MNLLRIAFVSLLLSPGAHAQVPSAERMTVAPTVVVRPVTQPQPVVTPVLQPAPTMIIAPPVDTKPPVMVKTPGTPAFNLERGTGSVKSADGERGAAAPASPGKISERSRAAAGVELPAVQSPGQIAKPGAMQLTPLDDAPASTPGRPVGDDAKSDQRELQEATQRESRQVQSISNIMKQKQDAANSIIQNMK